MAMEEVITKVPEKLKELVRVTSRKFYQPLQIVCLDILTKYPCVTLMDLVEVLKMHGSQKQLQQALNSLHKDKLVKWRQKMEVQPEAAERAEKAEEGKKPAPKMMHYYYINYKLFVNVVKYKLDHMRKKLESDTNMAQNRTSYKCSACFKCFSDLDVDRLFDPSSGGLRCSFCHNGLEEERAKEEEVDPRILISQLNEYVKPIADLLRETENLNLAPELLDPEPQSIQKYLHSSGVSRRPSSSGREATWARRSAMDIYGDSTEISVNIGDGSQQSSNAVPRERPEWMQKSTVFSSSDSQPFSTEDTPSELSQQSKRHKKDTSEDDRQILEDLMAHETRQSSSFPSSSQTMPGSSLEHAQYSSSSSGEEEGEEEEEAAGRGNVGGASSVSYMGVGRGEGGFDDVEEFEGSSDEEEEFTVRVGDSVVPVTEVTSEMVENMTAEEKRRYTFVFQKAWSQNDDY